MGARGLAIVRWLWRTVPDAARRPVPNTLPEIRAGRSSTISGAACCRRRSCCARRRLDDLHRSPLLWTVLAVLVLAFPT